MTWVILIVLIAVAMFHMPQGAAGTIGIMTWVPFALWVAVVMTFAAYMRGA
jgi:hypothetical protein